MRNPAESDMTESLALSKLINSNLQGGDDGEGVEHAAPVRKVGEDGSRGEDD